MRHLYSWYSQHLHPEAAKDCKDTGLILQTRVANCSLEPKSLSQGTGGPFGAQTWSCAQWSLTASQLKASFLSSTNPFRPIVSLLKLDP